MPIADHACAGAAASIPPSQFRPRAGRGLIGRRGPRRYMTIIESVQRIDANQKLKDLTQTNPAIMEREEFKNQPGGYKTKLGFGLHAGWAIEGAIGSNVKVDCSYLGPHMQVRPSLLPPPALVRPAWGRSAQHPSPAQMAERLETATKIYGTGLLVRRVRCVGKRHDTSQHVSENAMTHRKMCRKTP